MGIKINNWSSFQSYKDRKPPWIRLHKSLLDNFEFHSLSVDARALIFMLWLLASEDEDPVSGLIRYGYDKIAFRLRMDAKKVQSVCEELQEAEFILINQSCNETVTKQLHVCHETVTPETETETDSRRKYFKVPSVEEVKEYCKSRNNDVDYEEFCNFYQSKGWMVGKNKMKDWQAAVRRWESNAKTKQSKYDPAIHGSV